MTETKLPPHNIDAEENVIGSLLIDRDLIHSLSFEPSNFYHEQNGLCYAACKAPAECEKLYHVLGKELTLDDLVFAGAEGKLIDPSVLSHNFARIAKHAGLEGVRFHDLRHTFASFMLFRGIS